MKLLLISPYWKEPHRWMVSSFKLAELWRRMGWTVTVACMASKTGTTETAPGLTVHGRKDVFLPDPWNYGLSPGFSGFVSRLASAKKTDVVVVNKILFWSSFALIGQKLRGRRVILLTDALVGMTWWPRGRFPRVASAIYAWTAGWLLLLLADKVVFFHPQPTPLLKKLGIAGKSRVIPTGIDPKPYAQAALTRQSLPPTPYPLSSSRTSDGWNR